MIDRVRHGGPHGIECRPARTRHQQRRTATDDLGGNGGDLARGLAQAEELSHTGALPNMIFLYRRPILDYWAEHRETLGAIVSHVLIHEIGHHFGLSDSDMERIEREAS